jgi:hypothetical protein
MYTLTTCYSLKIRYVFTHFAQYEVVSAIHTASRAASTAKLAVTISKHGSRTKFKMKFGANLIIMKEEFTL